MTSSTNYRTGLAITFAGVMVLTFDSALVKLINGNEWTIMFWRGQMMFAGLAAWWLWQRAVNGRGIGFINGWMGAAVAVTYGFSTISFVVALHHTSAASLLFILALAPLIAAILSGLILGEWPEKATWIAIGISLSGISLILYDGIGRGSLYGDIVAFGSAFGLALAFVLSRKGGRNFSMAPGLGALVSSAFAFAFITDFGLSGVQWGYLTLNGLFLLPLSWALIAIGPRYLPAAEVAMMMLLETVFGPVWVWLAVGERPGLLSLVGGVIVVGTLSVYSLKRVKAEQTEPPATRARTPRPTP